MALSQDEVIDYLSNLSVMDLVNLTKSLEDKWGVKAAPVAVAAAPAAGGGAAAAPAEEKTEFTVVLKSGGAAKEALELAYRVTGQRGPWPVNIEQRIADAGFKAEVVVEELERSTVLLFVAEKLDGP